MSGDQHILTVYGAIGLNLAYCLRVLMLMVELEKENYVKDLFPGVCSLLNRFLKGNYIISISEETLSYAKYKKFLITNLYCIASFRSHRQKYYSAERTKWEAVDERDSDDAIKYTSRGNDTVTRNKMTYYADDAHIVVGKLYASIWSVHVVEGDIVQKIPILFYLKI